MESRLFHRFTVLCCAIHLVSSLLLCQAPVPQMGEPYRPSYEIYRSDKLTQAGEASYSGDLGFSIPLLTVPGRHGHNFDIAISYNSNISQRQYASWVGLGWNLEIGAVQRSIIGRSDDQKKYLWSGQNLGADDNNQGDIRAELEGRLSPENWSMHYQKRDVADIYNLMIDGGSQEILPFPASYTNDDTLDKDSFLPLQWKPWTIKASWIGGSNQITRFSVRKEDGSTYVFGQPTTLPEVGRGIEWAKVEGLTPNQTQSQAFWFPYRWNLTQILYPDGALTRVSYKDHSGDYIQRTYESMMMDRSYVAEVGNVFEKRDPAYPSTVNSKVFYQYSCPETLFTDTHYALFSTSEATADSTDRLFKLNSIILYERATNTELKRVVFIYATNSDTTSYYNVTQSAPNWSNNTKLNNNQLTLISVYVQSAGEGNIMLPPYAFSYYQNPKVDPHHLSTYSNVDPSFPGYHTDTLFGRAWRLKELLLPTKGKISFSYQCLNNSNVGGGFDVDYDPKARHYSVYGTNPWSYKLSPRSRLVQKSVRDTMGMVQTWTYTYCDTAHYDAPSRPIGMNFIPKSYLDAPTAFFGFTSADYQKFFRGCPIGHRWTKVTNPDGTWKKIYYTSSYRGPGANSLESQLDSIENSASGAAGTDFVVVRSNAGGRGLVWKEETNLSTTLYKYSYVRQGQFLDRFEYFPLTGGGNRGDMVEQTSIWPRLDTVVTIRDGVTSKVYSRYNASRRQDGAGNGLIWKRVEFGGNTDRTTEYDYAYRIYPGMDTYGMWSQIYSTTLKKGADDVESKEWTTWGIFGGKWLPRKNWRWNSTATDRDAPADTTSEVLGSTVYEYDSQGYSNVIKQIDANGISTQYFYGSNSTPYVTTTAGLSLGYVTGVQLPKSSPSLKRSFKYDLWGNVTQKKDENGDSTLVTYDQLGRISYVFGPNNQKLQRFVYDYYASASQPNRITTKLYRSAIDSIVSMIYYDGIGYERQRMTALGSDDIISTTTYDSLRRVSRMYETYTYPASHLYDASFASHCATDNPDAGVYPYSLSTYETDYAGRKRQQFYPDTIFSNSNLVTNHYTTYTYGANAEEIAGYSAGMLNKTTVTDENGKKRSTYFDKLGNNVAILVDSAGLNLTTLMEYEIDGKLRRIVMPRSYPPPQLRDTVNIPSPSQSDSVIIRMLPAGVAKTAEVILATRGPEPGPSAPGHTGRAYDPENPGSTNDRERLKPMEEPGISLYYRIKQYSNGTLLSVSAQYMISDPAPKPDWDGTHSAVYSIASNADEVRLVVTSVVYEEPTYSAELKLECSSPEGQLLDSYNSYNTVRQLVKKFSIDGGVVCYRYDIAGNLRFSQDSVQAVAGKFTYQKYDSLYRVIEIGEYTGNFWTADSTTRGSSILDFPTTGGSLLARFTYDQNTTGDPALSSSRNLLGRLFSSFSYTNGLRDEVYYSYDDFGRPEWQVYKFNPAYSAKKIIYEYDFQGNITKQGYENIANASDNTYVFYDYDAIGRLSKVYAGRNSSGSDKSQEAYYTYDETNKLKRTQLASAQGVDYLYNERGWLKQINSPYSNTEPAGLPADQFGMTIGYNQIADIGSSQSATAQYNGNISWAAYSMNGANYTGGAGTTSIVGNSYAYDNGNRLTKADFGYRPSGTWQSTNAFDVSKITYDKNGNFDSVYCYGSNAGLMDQLKYNYPASYSGLSTEALDPGTFYQRGPLWTYYPGSASFETVLRDGASPDDNTLLRYSTSEDEFWQDFTVNLDDLIGVIDPSGTIVVYCRLANFQPTSGFIYTNFKVLEGSTTLGTNNQYITNGFVTDSILIPVSSVANVNNLRVKVEAYGFVNSGGAGTDVSWVRAKIPTRIPQPSGNRLLYISDVVSSTAFTTDIDNQATNNYKYDKNGSIIKDLQRQFDTLRYDYRNLPYEVKTAGVLTKYRYDVQGNRIQKYSPNGINYYYLYDVKGRPFVILNGLQEIQMLNFHGLDHFGYMTVTYQTTYIPPPPGCEEELSMQQLMGEDSTGLEVPGDSTGSGALEDSTGLDIEEDSTAIATASSGGGGGGCQGTYITERIDNRYYYLKDHLGTIKMTVNSSGTVVSYDDYYPFGGAMQGRSMTGTGDARYKFIGKERDSETGLDWLELRGYDQRVARANIVDPKAGEGALRSWSPYHYSYDNPVLWKDPSGANPEVFVTGNDAERAVQELQKQTNLILTRDAATGKLSSSGMAVTDADQVLCDAINDPNIAVNLEATSSNQVTSKVDGSPIDLTIGAFDGSKSQGNQVVASQFINVDHVNKASSIAGSAGQNVMHEIVESYMGAKLFPGQPFSDSRFQISHSAAMQIIPIPRLGISANKLPGTNKFELGVYPINNPKQVIPLYRK